ncbi:MAG TPA: helix-turn-helix transcriptional regulator [Actinomycetota bacterium]|nr:helix-turn-helix transcriptional regulator [Actinomycetota bacterium]
MNVRGVGEYIRSQRTNARLSLKKVSALAGVSIPYLSQIERGLRKPSADILQAIAKALRVSAETLYVQAGFLDDRSVPDVATAILADPTITERQKQALLQIYEAFRDETGRAGTSETDVIATAGLATEQERPARTRSTQRKRPSAHGRHPTRPHVSSKGGGTRHGEHQA